jgi:hypothetical protein
MRTTLDRQLPRNLSFRLPSLLAKEQARFLWHTNASCPITSTCHADLQLFCDLLRAESESWSTPIAAIIPRTPHFQSLGDASRIAGGAYCDLLQFWFTITWSDRVRTGLAIKDHSDPRSVHINSLEFIVLIIQVAAASVAFTDPTFPNWVRRPAFPVYEAYTDNTSAKAWTNKF